jgi:DNA modification methylase
MNLGTARVIQGDARHLPLADNTVDLVVTSPPYFALRSYQDGGEHYAGQLGSEATPAEFVAALLEVTRECVRVLKPTGSLWVNLGDSYSSGGRATRAPDTTTRRRGFREDSRPRDGMRAKTLIGIPWRYALACIDDLGLILRAEVIWSKPNGLPESVTDRVRRSHEQWFHFTLEPRYFSAVDEIRETYTESSLSRARYATIAGPEGGTNGKSNGTLRSAREPGTSNPLGKLPGSVWTVPTEPLRVPDHLGIDHFAAFPTEWPRRIIQGWSPAGVCTGCGEGRRPVIASVGLDMNRPQARRAQELADRHGLTEAHFKALLSVGVSDTGRGAATQTGTGKNTPEVYALADRAREALGGYAREYLRTHRPCSLRCPTRTVWRSSRRTPDDPALGASRLTHRVARQDPRAGLRPIIEAMAGGVLLRVRDRLVR